MKLKKLLLAGLALILVIFISAHLYFMDRGRWTTVAEYSGLARTVSGNELVSASDPALALRFKPDFQYLGGQKFILYGVADTEQHFFARLSESGALTSLFWIQFEAYLPDKNYQYDYEDSPLRLHIDNYKFFTDTAAVRPDPKNRRRGSDGARAREFLAAKGLSMPDDFAYARAVYLTDASRKKELMIIFIDDLAQYGLTAPALKKDGQLKSRWPEIEKKHLEKLADALTLVPLER